MYDGTVTKAKNTGGGEGFSIIVTSKSAEGETTSYWHLTGAAEGIQVGSKVEGGQLIGYTGTSGNANPKESGREAHLHARKQVDGEDVNPGLQISE
jgi:murein DD-endopeptidase MepM/ murein hydrolase activator NlpD